MGKLGLLWSKGAVLDIPENREGKGGIIIIFQRVTAVYLFEQIRKKGLLLSQCTWHQQKPWDGLPSINTACRFGLSSFLLQQLRESETTTFVHKSLTTHAHSRNFTGFVFQGSGKRCLLTEQQWWKGKGRRLSHLDKPGLNLTGWRWPLKHRMSTWRRKWEAEGVVSSSRVGGKGGRCEEKEGFPSSKTGVVKAEGNWKIIARQF